MSSEAVRGRVVGVDLQGKDFVELRIMVCGGRWGSEDVTILREDGDRDLVGPFGWLVADPALDEGLWQLRDDPASEAEKSDGVLSFPLHLKAEDAAALIFRLGCRAGEEERAEITNERKAGA